MNDDLFDKFMKAAKEWSNRRPTITIKNRNNGKIVTGKLNETSEDFDLDKEEGYYTIDIVEDNMVADCGTGSWDLVDIQYPTEETDK